MGSCLASIEAAGVDDVTRKSQANNNNSHTSLSNVDASVTRPSLRLTLLVAGVTCLSLRPSHSLLYMPESAHGMTDLPQGSQPSARAFRRASSFGPVVSLRVVRFAGWRAGEGRSSQRSTSALLDGGQARIGRHSAAQQVRRSSLNFILPSSGDRAALCSTASSAGSPKPDADGSTDGVDQHS